MDRSFWLNGSFNRQPRLDELMQSHLGEALSGILLVLTNVAIAAVKGVDV
jgi:hypothetical protein